jgi:hypothetical protein
LVLLLKMDGQCPRMEQKTKRAHMADWAGPELPAWPHGSAQRSWFSALLCQPQRLPCWEVQVGAAAGNEWAVPAHQPAAKAPKWCEDCQTAAHNTLGCWNRPENAEKCPGKRRKKAAVGTGQTTEFTQEQVSALFQGVFGTPGQTATEPAAEKRKKAEAQKDTDSGSDDDPAAHFAPELDEPEGNASDDAFICMSFPRLRETTSTGKRRKLSHCAPELVAETVNQDGETAPIRALCDSGAIRTALLRKCAAPGGNKGHG